MNSRSPNGMTFSRMPPTATTLAGVRARALRSLIPPPHLKLSCQRIATLTRVRPYP